MDRPRKLHIKSYGCQMNVYDAERMVDTLARENFVETAEVMVGVTEAVPGPRLPRPVAPAASLQATVGDRGPRTRVGATGARSWSGSFW